ncbi:unnamed protein product [Fraxinus pennsylvanica]|uniref:Uncharacterized protein n=1 Tax=Fraxinus pennsylvanica TaxID=56036 RepID=A0AAD2E6V2_9LAMI|nr:unnamed protein product [Fraxinus pennsylvanica]
MIFGGPSSSPSSQNFLTPSSYIHQNTFSCQDLHPQQQFPNGPFTPTVPPTLISASSRKSIPPTHIQNVILSSQQHKKALHSILASKLTHLHIPASSSSTDPPPNFDFSELFVPSTSSPSSSSTSQRYTPIAASRCCCGFGWRWEGGGGEERREKGGDGNGVEELKN